MSQTETPEPPAESGDVKKEKEGLKPLKEPVYLNDNFKILIVDSTKAFDSVVKIFRQDVQDFRIITIDTETRVVTGKSNYNYVDLLQIGTLAGNAFLFRLHYLRQSEVNYLRNILADPTITKIGSLFRSQARRLANDWNVFVYNWIDIQNVIGNCFGKRTLGEERGLLSITKAYVGVELEKFNAESQGNWGAEELSDSQINYAARDVIAIADIFLNVHATKSRLSSISADEIKQHVAWAKFCSNALYLPFA